MNSPKDVWAIGDAYEQYVGRWSSKVAPLFLQRLFPPAQLKWLDVGCGTGALSQAILDHAAPAAVVGVEPSEGFLATARRRVTDPRAEFRPGGGEKLPVDDGAFDMVVSGLVLNFIPDQPKAVTEMRRAARDGGTVAAYVWDYAEGMQLMRVFWDAAAALDEKAKPLDEAVRFPGCKPDPLRALLSSAGLNRVESFAVEVPTVFADFDDYWSPFLGGQGPAPGYCMSLPEPQRVALRERIRKALPVESDGRIPLTARAWCVRGEK